MGLFGFGKNKDEVLEAKLSKLDTKLENKKTELSQLKQEIKLAKEFQLTIQEIEKKKAELNELNTLLSLANDDIGLQEYGFFERQYKFSNSTQYKDKLDTVRAKEKNLVKQDKAGEITQPMTLNNSVAKGKAMQKQLIKAAIRGFNGEADALLTKITVSNVEQKVKALRKSFEQLNKMYARNSIAISFEYLDLKIEELRLAAEYELQKQEEKELLREQREKEREDKKLQAEIARQRKQISKDRKHFHQMVENVEEMLKNAQSEEIEELKQQLREYQNKLAELDEYEADIDYREGNATAGYVYVISNIGSFGKDVYKIGVTRRLEPLERIRELSSASVPFQFDVHALVFSEQAFSLETELHNELKEYKVNKVNNRKEYFKVSFEKIKEVLDKHKELTIELTEKPEAFEYHQSLILSPKSEG